MEGRFEIAERGYVKAFDGVRLALPALIGGCQIELLLVECVADLRNGTNRLSRKVEYEVEGDRIEDVPPGPEVGQKVDLSNAFFYALRSDVAFDTRSERRVPVQIVIRVAKLVWREAIPAKEFDRCI